MGVNPVGEPNVRFLVLPLDKRFGVESVGAVDCTLLVFFTASFVVGVFSFVVGVFSMTAVPSTKASDTEQTGGNGPAAQSPFNLKG